MRPGGSKAGQGRWLWTAATVASFVIRLKRDFQKLVDRHGRASAIGQAGLKAMGARFAWWDSADAV